MHDLNLALAVAGGLVLLHALLARLLERLGFSPQLPAFVVGTFLGPAGQGLMDPGDWGEEPTILGQAARLTLAVGLMGVGLRLLLSYLVQNKR